MIFEQEHIVFEILDVFYLEQPCIKKYNANRHFDAISFRYESDTVIETDEKQVELLDNAICYFPSNVNYTRYSRKDKLIVVHFKAFNYRATTVECFHPENPEKYQKLFQEILFCWNNKETSYKYECSSLLNKIFSELYKDNQSGFENSKIQNSVLYIEKNYLRSDFSLSLAASKSFISETYFRKLFQEAFHISPKQYVVERRMDHAKALLITGYFSIQKVAELCGYKDEKHFSAEFRKHTGTAPSRYRYNYEQLIKKQAEG